MSATPEGVSEVSTTNGSDSDISLSGLQDSTDEQALLAHLDSIGIDRQASAATFDTSSGPAQHPVNVGHQPQATLSEHIAAQDEAFEAARNRARNPMHCPAIQRFVQEVSDAPWKRDLSGVNLPASETQTTSMLISDTSLEVERSQGDDDDSSSNISQRGSDTSKSDNTDHTQDT